MAGILITRALDSRLCNRRFTGLAVVNNLSVNAKVARHVKAFWQGVGYGREVFIVPPRIARAES